jgi:peptide deformylase
MAVIPIRMLGDPVLRTKASDVDAFDHRLARLAEDMFETMYAAPGVGLAAPQVGLSIRLFVYDSGQGDRGVVANPELSELADEQGGDEGCLSVPGLYYPTTRSDRVRLDGLDLRGERITLHGEGYLARIFQHETDHTNGLLYLDRLERGARKQAMADLRERELAPSPARRPRQL